MQPALTEVFGDCQPVVQPFLSALTDSERQLLVSDYHRGGRAIATIMSAKLAFWTVLPWKLIGIMIPCEAEARAIAKECIQLYDKNPDPLHHHRLSNSCLAHSSPIRRDILKFIDGTALKDLSADTLKVLVPLKFIPVCERVIESKHAAVATNLSGKRRKRSPVTVSLFSGRLRELSLRIDSNAEFLSVLVRHLESVRNARQQAQVFGLLEHPLLQELLSQEEKVHPTKFETKVRSIFYHCDPQQQYMDITEVSRDLAVRHRAETADQKELRRLGHQEREGDPEGPPWQRLLLDHVVLKAKQRGIGWTFSFPAEAARLTSLPQLLQCPVGSALPSLMLAERSSTVLHSMASVVEDDEAWMAAFDPQHPADSSMACATRITIIHVSTLQFDPRVNRICNRKALLLG